MTAKPILAIAVGAHFEPEGAQDGVVEWTFQTMANNASVFGVYEIRFVRHLTPGEVSGAVDVKGILTREDEDT